MLNPNSARALFVSLLLLTAACSDTVQRQGSDPGPDLNASVGTPAVSGAAAGGPQSDIQPPHIGDPNEGGTASELFIRDLSYGRLVQVFDIEAGTGLRRPVYGDVVVGPNVATDGVDYQLDENLAHQEELTILHEAGSPAFDAALAAAELARVLIRDAGLPSQGGPWPMIPRNGAISIRFSDLLDASSVSSQNIGIQTGYPPVEDFAARVLVDRNHGALGDPDGDGIHSFYSTRVILDLTVSQLELLNSSEPLVSNAAGLPGSTGLSAANGVLRIPTRVSPAVGQVEILRNPAGNGLAFNGNGTIDTGVSSLDALRAFRSGGELTGDAFDGALPDTRRPRVVGRFEVNLGGTVVADPNVPGGFIVPVTTLLLPDCASPIAPGDLLVQGHDLIAVVYGLDMQSGASILGLKVRRLTTNGGDPSSGSGQIVTTYDAAQDDPRCFVAFSPVPGTPPNGGVATAANATVRFSEPMRSASLRPFDSFTVTRSSGPFTPHDYVVGEVVSAAGLDAFSFAHPSAPFAHQQGQAETYYANLGSGPKGPVDLAGNPLGAALPQVSFRLDPSEPSSANGGFAMRFHLQDEFFGDGLHELRYGQLLFDPVNERILPRPVSRFQVAADRNQPVPSVMTPFIGGTQTPLSSFGSKLHTLWRYCDVGFSLLDEEDFNVDVEGLSWAPVGGSVVSDFYPEFAIALSHSEWLPDEFLNTGSGFPQWPASGLKQPYANNYNDPIHDPGTIVHPKELGYVVTAGDLYTASSGTTMLPYPLNQGVAPGDARYYTWRDTALTALGGPSGHGAMLDQEELVLFGGVGVGGQNKTYPASGVPTIGLPLLMDIRCYASPAALGLNALDISLAANSSARPNFRAFSTGGYDTNNIAQVVDPDTEVTASGGYNPGSNPPGQPTLPTDNTFYIGELALVTRVSRSHSIWFDTGFSQATFAPPVLEHRPGGSPGGTSVVLAFRGATAIAGQNPSILADAGDLDPYGEALFPNFGVPAFTNGDGSWQDDIAQIDGSRYFQVRLTFISNAETGDTADLHSLGFAYLDATGPN